ncbi:cupin domain-containing protein [Actinomycetes bacterium M1A6_2h]
MSNTDKTTFSEMNLDAVRRYVVGVDDDGLSKTVIDDTVANLQANPNFPGVSAATLWREGQHTDSRYHADGLETYDRLPKGGAQFFLVKIDPGVSVPMHSTRSVDFHFVISGQLTCLLDKGEFTVHAGDVMIQRGGQHGWENRGEVPYISVATLKSVLTESAS